MAVFEKISRPQNLNGSYYYLIIPVDGCGPCTRKSITFSKKNKNNLKFRPVFVSKNGKKAIVLAYGEDLPKRFIIDYKGLFFDENFTNGTVHLIKIVNGNIVEEDDYLPDDVDKKLSLLLNALTVTE